MTLQTATAEAERASHASERILIVEDDSATRGGLTELVRTWGFLADSAADGEEGLEKISSFRPSIVVTDLVMPRRTGLALREVKALRRQLRDKGAFGGMIGASPEMRKIYQVIEQAAPTTASVLITGESGTGKELVAQTIHQLSPRGQMPYVPINCAAIPETLLESEIFGHEKGAFTGAMERRQGVFELADRGTIFLDEIPEVTPTTQVKLLRVLQERRFRRLGGRVETPVDVRVIAATNVDPLQAVRDVKLREDLYYRLNVFSIGLPPLRDRKEDLPLLTQAFIGEFAERNGRSVKAVSADAMRKLEQYHWPGNVRELRNVIERATILAEGEFVEVKDRKSTR